MTDFASHWKYLGFQLDMDQDNVCNDINDEI